MQRVLNIALVAIGLGFVPAPTSAQPREGRFLHVAVGYGLSWPFYSYGSNIDGTGVFAEVEYVIGLSRWVGFRGYGGMVLTWPHNRGPGCNADHDCEVSAKIAVLGAKGRIALPIPWVAPFIEYGLGVSLGAIRTTTQGETHARDGAALHIPVTLGLALGSNHEFEFALVYYAHRAEEQFSGAVAIGLSLPLGESE